MFPSSLNGSYVKSFVELNVKPLKEPKEEHTEDSVRVIIFQSMSYVVL